MANICVDQWSAAEVADWIGGLGLPVCGYSQNFRERNITGDRLVNFIAGDLEAIGVSRVGDQILLHDAIQSLKREMESDWVTLQVLASQLSVRCKTYRSQLTNLPKQNRIPTEYLASAVYLLDAGKTLLKWIPFLGTIEYINIGTKLTKYCFELALLSQRDSFADNIIEEVQYLCTKIIEICDDIIKSRDSLVIQPATCEMVTLKKRKEQKFGFDFEECSQTGQHLITRVDLNSPAYHNLEVGDEILQVNHRTVLSWDYKKVQALIRDKAPETTVVLMIRRKPKHGRVLYDIYVRPSRTPRRTKLITRVIEESEPGICDTQPEITAATHRRAPPSAPEATADRFEVPLVASGSSQELHPKSGLQRRATIGGVNPSREVGGTKAPPGTPATVGDVCASSNMSHILQQQQEGGRIRRRPPLDKSKSDSEWQFRFSN